MVIACPNGPRVHARTPQRREWFTVEGLSILNSSLAVQTSKSSTLNRSMRVKMRKLEDG